MPKKGYVQNENQSNHLSLQERKINSDVLTSSKIGLQLINVDRSKNYQFLAYFFSRVMQDRDSCRLDPYTSIQERKSAVYRTSPVLKAVPFWLTVANGIFQFRFLKRWLVCSNLFLYVGHFQA